MTFLDDVLDNVGKEHAGGKGFEYGTHEVVIGEAEATTKKTQKHDAAPIISVTVFDEADNEKTATCTLWFHSEGGAKMAVTKILGILIHNVSEDKKDSVRELGRKLFGSAEDASKAREIAIKLIQEKLVGKKAFITAEPTGKYSTTKYADLWHYPAEPQNSSKPTVDTSQAPGVDPKDIPEFDEGDV